MPQDLDDRPRDLRLAAEAGGRPIGLMATSRHASVYAVEADGRPAVLKVIVEGADPVARLRFAREGRLGLSLRHPSLALTLRCAADWILLGDVRAGSGGPVQSLGHRVRNSGPDAALAAGLGGVAEALAHMHACGLVHRDVKPSNILIGPHDHPVLIDLGAVGLEAGDDLGAGEIIGSPAWMAPEQARGEPPRTTADVYSLALVFAYALIQIPAFTGSADTVLGHRQRGGGPGQAFMMRVDGITNTTLRQLVVAGLSDEPSARPPALAFAWTAAAFKF